jgi:hypothetical protein
MTGIGPPASSTDGADRTYPIDSRATTVDRTVYCTAYCPDERPGRRARAAPTLPTVAYDEDLADRIRELLADESGWSEKKMFGGLAFLVGGHLAVSASGRGGLMVRVDPGRSDQLIATTKAYRMEMRGRPMDGWLRVDAEHVRTKRQLAPWVRRGAEHARSLPPKGRTPRPRT